MLPAEQSRGLSIQRKKNCNTRLKFRRFWVEEPRHSENVLAEKKSATCAVARLHCDQPL